MKKFLVLLVAMASNLSASMVTFSHISPTTEAPFTDTFTLQKFDTTLGVLTGVLINFASNTNAEVDIYNFSGRSQPFSNATATIPLTLDTPSGAIVANAIAGPFSGNAASGFNSFPGLTATNSSSTNVASLNFGLYQGAGTTNASFSVTAGAGQFSGAANPGVFFGGTSTAGGVTTVTYTYTAADPTPTPELGTIGLLGSALFGLQLLKLRSRR